MSSMRRVTTWVAATAAVLLFWPNTARPCGNAVHLSLDDATVQVASAEKHLRLHHHAKVRRMASPGDFVFPNEQLGRKAKVLYWVASMRLRPTVENGKYAERELASGDRKDPQLQAWRAEALFTGRAYGKAQALLDDLAERDLMPDAYAYRVLALLHQREGRAEAVATALERCTSMAQGKKRECDLEWSPARSRRARR